VTLLTWDGDPSGGSGADPVISATTCESPSIEASAGHDTTNALPITCESTESLGETCR
jgi:hypothetical protein